MCSLEFDIAHRELVVSCLLAPSFQAIDRRVSRECSCQSLWIDGSNQSINRVEEEKPWKNPPIGHHRLWHSKKSDQRLGCGSTTRNTETTMNFIHHLDRDMTRTHS